MFDFGDAIYFAKAGLKVFRESWYGGYVWMQEPDFDGMAPYLEKVEDGTHTPYIPSMEDMLADDWEAEK